MVDSVVFENSTRHETSTVDENIDGSMLGHILTYGGLQVRIGNVQYVPFTSKLLDLVDGFGCLRWSPRGGNELVASFEYCETEAEPETEEQPITSQSIADSYVSM